MYEHRVRGKINIGCLTLSLLLIIAGYVGFKFGRVYVAQYMLDRKIFEIAGDAAEDYRAKIFPSERDIADVIMEEARKRSVDITYDDIIINRERRYVKIKVTWEGDIVLPFYTHHFIHVFDHERKIVY